MNQPVTSAFEVLPAIDIRGGKVVRLQQGDFERETTFSNDPIAVARSFLAAGVRWLHVVDLDGARTGEPAQAAVIKRLIAAVGDRAAVEVAGGLRTEDAVAAALSAGAARVVVGTAALREPAFADRLIATHGPERIVVALDVRDGLALGEGWRTGASGTHAEEIMASLADRGVTTFELTAIDRDGLLGGPDLDLLRRLVRLRRGGVIASGGIASIDDIEATRRIGCIGAVVGRALYEGELDLAGAVATSGERWRNHRAREVERPVRAHVADPQQGDLGQSEGGVE